MCCETLNLIRQSKARYCRYIDSKQWKAFRDLFSPDASIQIIDTAGATMAQFDNTDDFVKSAIDFIGAGQSIHQVHNEEFEQISGEQIEAIWSMEDYIVFPATHHPPLVSVHGYGHYFETWRKSGNTWQISKLQLRRSILELVHRSEAQ
jgi:hypothetical protein